MKQQDKEKRNYMTFFILYDYNNIVYVAIAVLCT